MKLTKASSITILIVLSFTQASFGNDDPTDTSHSPRKTLPQRPDTESATPSPTSSQQKGWGSWLVDQGKNWGNWAVNKVNDTGIYGKAAVNWFKNNPNMVIHGLTDGLTIVAINMGSFGNVPGMMVEMAVFVPRWYYGYTFMEECDEQIAKASSSTAPHASENQVLVAAKKGSGIIHLASDAADVAIRALRDGVGFIVSPSIKKAVTTVTFVTQLFDFGVAYKVEVNNLKDKGKKQQ